LKQILIAFFLLMTGSTKAQQEVPVLCYHQIRTWKSSDSKFDKEFIAAPAVFEQQMKLLHDSGYHTILPDALINAWQKNIRLPEKTVVLTFDDGCLSQFTDALPVLNRYGFKAVFFIMTVTLDKPNYMSRAQVKAISEQGHLIGCHTWDHHNVKQYKKQDWQIQLVKPTLQLEQITGKLVNYFAYPYGVWDSAAVAELQQYNYKAAFQLAGKGDNTHPLFTINRMIADGQWTIARFATAISTKKRL
jgi:peptidoglycan/xylan/chitin deacetylase (PgdA/CDA1 family)